MQITMLRTFNYTFIFVMLLSFGWSAPLAAQDSACVTFEGSGKKDMAMEAHVLYRDQVKLKNFDAAYDNWMKAYEMAPAADGKRAFHYSDGRKILMHKYKNETDEAKKKELAAQILKLYDEQMVCYGADGEEARLLGRKAFDMFYTLRTPYGQVETVLAKAVEEGGNATEYISLVPYATVVQYLFTNEKMDKATARGVYQKLNDIADHNIENNEKYSGQYKQAKESMNGTFAQIENYIFDCAYFVEKLKPDYEADPDNPEVLESTIRTLKRRGCEESEPFLAELEGKWAKYAAEINAKRQAEFEANNPQILAKKAYDAGDFKEAVAKYKEAIANEVDAEKQANYYFSVASIQFRKLKSYSAARESARKAASLRSGWGRPYMLIGDMYGSSARNCGDSWNQRLAILAAIEKYRYAKSVDPSVAEEANKRIGKYNASKPEQSEGFMRQMKAGDKAKVGCWIGETVTISFQ